MRYRRPDSNPARLRPADYLAHLREPATVRDLSQKTGRHYNTIWRVWIPRLTQWGLIKKVAWRSAGGWRWTLTSRGWEILGATS